MPSSKTDVESMEVRYVNISTVCRVLETDGSLRWQRLLFTTVTDLDEHIPNQATAFAVARTIKFMDTEARKFPRSY